MEKLRILKHFSLCLTAICAGIAIADTLMQEYLWAIFDVVCCALSHFCHNYYDKRLKRRR